MTAPTAPLRASITPPALFTDDPAAQTFIRNDPLGLRVGTAGLLAASVFHRGLLTMGQVKAALADADVVVR